MAKGLPGGNPIFQLAWTGGPCFRGSEAWA